MTSRSARVGWLDCSSGVSGDMMLGALDDLGALDGLPAALASLSDLHVSCVGAPTERAGLAARQVTVTAAGAQPPRRLADVTALLVTAAVPAPVRDRALQVFDRLADAEAAVHGVARDEVHFHEVGAVDAIVDVLGVCLGVHALELDRLVVSPVALGGGSVTTEHGELPVPGPAVLRLLAASALEAHGGPVDVELATPTGVALLAALATGVGTMPGLRVSGIGVGAGSRDLPGRPNVLRFVVGTATEDVGSESGWLLTEANVDDLDPRLWPTVLAALLDAGAADAWLTPIVMKKGRPAHTVSILTDDASATRVREVLFRESSTIGVRTTTVGKHVLDRSWIEVDVDGQPVRVKVATLGGDVMNAAPEWEDVAAAARALGRPAKVVLSAAIAATSAALG